MIRFGSRQIDDVHRYGILSFTDVIVKSSNVGAIKVGLKLGPERLGRYVSRFGFGQALAPRLPRRERRHRVEPDQARSGCAGIGVDGLSGRRDAGADGDGGQFDRQRRDALEPRVVRATIQDGRRTEVPHKALRRTVSERTAAR